MTTSVVGACVMGLIMYVLPLRDDNTLLGFLELSCQFVQIFHRHVTHTHTQTHTHTLTHTPNKEVASFLIFDWSVSSM